MTAEFLSPASFLVPARLHPQSAWNALVPFAFWLVDAARPRTVVELGTHTGVSYFAFCQAVDTLGLETRCYAVDTWEGDEHAGYYGEEVFAEVSHHNERYGSFSSLVRSTFDEAAADFADGSIDLLHVDGLHSYEAVSRDLETWLPKLSERGIVLLHDTQVLERGFGVAELWRELVGRYPSFELLHGSGLGLVAVGARVPEAVASLAATSDEERAAVRSAYARLGGGLEDRVELDALARRHREAEREIERLSAELARARPLLTLAPRLWFALYPLIWTSGRVRRLAAAVRRDPAPEEAVARSGLVDSPLFDARWYAAAVSEAERGGAEPLAHFVTEGASEGRDPNRFFSTRLWETHGRERRESVVAYLARTSASIGDRPVLTGVHAGGHELADGDDVCVYAHFDPDGLVDPYVVLALEGLAAAGLKTIFVSSCPRIAEPELAKVADTAALAVTSTNEGRDWGLYHAGLELCLSRVRPASVTLLNDSVYAHLSPLPAFLDRVRAASSDVTGATDSYEQWYHLQSYFLHLGRAALASGLVEEFLAHYVPVRDKGYVINAYEIGFSRLAESRGLALGAIWDYRTLEDRARAAGIGGARAHPVRSGIPTNPSHFLWDILLEDACPFLKIELLRDNPARIENVDRFRPPVADPAAARVIDDHLRRVAARPPRRRHVRAALPA